MKKTLLSFMIFLVLSPWLLSQGTEPLLYQKLTYENNLKRRIESALEEILGSDNFVVDVEVELTMKPSGERPGVYQPTRELTPAEERKAEEVERTTIDELLPGIPYYETEKARPEELKAPELKGRPAEAPESRLVEQKAGFLPMISKLNVTVILEDGLPVERMAEVRRVASVLARLRPERGDNLRLLTSTFGKRPQEMIARLQEDLQAAQQRVEDITDSARIAALAAEERTRERWDFLRDPLVLAILAGLLFILLLLLILLILSRRGRRKMMVPYGYEEGELVPLTEGVPRKKKKSKEEKEGEERRRAEEEQRKAEEAKALEEAKKRAEEERERLRRAGLLKADIKAARQAVVALSVGSPEAATDVVREWLESEEGGEEAGE